MKAYPQEENPYIKGALLTCRAAGIHRGILWQEGWLPALLLPLPVLPRLRAAAHAAMAGPVLSAAKAARGVSPVHIPQQMCCS